MGSRSPICEGAILGERGAHCKVQRLSTMSCAKTAEPTDLLCGLWTQVGRKKHMFNRICQVAPMCPHGRSHWCHLANTIELSICSNVALCEITLTTCYVCGHELLVPVLDSWEWYPFPEVSVIGQTGCLTLLEIYWKFTKSLEIFWFSLHVCH